MLLRCTTKLATALRLGTLPRVELAEAQAPLSEWSANIVRTSAGRLVVLMDARTRLVVLSPHAQTVRLMNDLEGRIASLLRALALPDAIVSNVVQGLGTTQFAKTADRKLIGALNEAPQPASGSRRTFTPHPSAMPELLVGEDACLHRLGNRRGANTDTGVVSRARYASRSAQACSW